MTRMVVVFLAVSVAASAAMPAADSKRGAEVFVAQSCNLCHAINGAGPNTGPDLGAIVDRGFTPAAFASTMWNHAPAMWSVIRQRNVPPPAMDEQAAADLFAFFYSTRYFEQPGDAGRGKRLFDSRACSSCHGVTDTKNPAARPAVEWTSPTDPIAMIETMWNHAANMRDEMARRNVKWPLLSGQDVADMLVYLRNLPAGQRGRTGIFQTTGGANGKTLFDSKGCTQCHKSADQFLETGLPGETLTDVAAEMWNHAVTKKGRAMAAAQIHFEPGEMKEIASYIWSRRMFENTGNADRGKRAFTVRRCASCHDDAASGAPPLNSGGREFSDITMISVLWQHGPAMLGRMQEKLMPWPHLTTREMTDLIAYLNVRLSPKAQKLNAR